jgi:uncharacterized protein (TIGR03067 family)
MRGRFALVLCQTLLVGAGCKRGLVAPAGTPAARPAAQVSQPAAPATRPPESASRSSGGLDGTWKAVAVEQDGMQVPSEEVTSNPAVVEVSGNTMTVKVGTRVFAQGTLKLDASRQPKTMDVTGIALAGGKAGQTGESFAIYEVNGDTLKLCFAHSAAARPQSFQTRPGLDATLITYQRVR